MTKRICSYTMEYTIELCLHSAVNYAGCVTVFNVSKYVTYVTVNNTDLVPICCNGCVLDKIKLPHSCNTVNNSYLFPFHASYHIFFKSTFSWNLSFLLWTDLKYDYKYLNLRSVMVVTKGEAADQLELATGRLEINLG